MERRGESILSPTSGLLSLQYGVNERKHGSELGLKCWENRSSVCNTTWQLLASEPDGKVSNNFTSDLANDTGLPVVGISPAIRCFRRETYSPFSAGESVTLESHQLLVFPR